MKCRPFVAICLVAVAPFVGARAAQTPPSPIGDGLFDGLHFRSIGPATMGGRIDAIAAYADRPAMFYVGAATGGLWKTTNNGTTWETLFTDQDVVSIGDVAVTSGDPNLVWVGTGENNNRQSSSWGGGVYKSTDGGHTWKNMGLVESRHVGRVLIDPANHDVVYVAATGHLWGPNPDRGVFKTTDGGASWAKVLFVDDQTGASDVVMDPTDSKVLYAAMYQRQRTAFGFNGGGPGSGLYKSVDAGKSWTRLTDGLPAGPLGRMAIDIFRKNPGVVFALVQAQRDGGLYRSDDAGAHWRKIGDTNPRPNYFSQVRVDPTDDRRVYVLGVRLMVSDDGGRSFAETRVQPAAGGDRPRDDLDMHALWIDPSDPHHLVAGSDVGVAISYDRAARWDFVDNLVISQMYHVGYDMERPYHVLGGLQDNDVWMGPSATRTRFGIGNWEWRSLAIGDGFVALADPRDPTLVYGETQDGNISRVDRETGERKTIRPQAGRGEPPLRWAWDTPFIVSRRDPSTILMAAQKVFLSPDRGQSWRAISPDLTTGVDRETLPIMGLAGRNITLSKNDGVSAYPTIVAIADSPRRAGVYYAGTDDGLVHVTRNGGKTWSDLTARIPGAPEGAAVSRIAASAFDDGTVYIAFNNHRRDDYAPYLFASRDFGATWKRIVSLPAGQTINCVTEDTKDADVLYVGTEFGLFVSLDRGDTWMRVRANLPTVPIDEITIHPRDNDLLLATHGRGIWILDDLAPVQHAAEAQRAAAFLFPGRPAAAFNPSNERANYHGDRRFWGENPPPGAAVTFWLKQPATELTFVIRDERKAVVRELTGDRVNAVATPGIHRVYWDLRHQAVAVRSAAGGGRGGGGGSASQTAGRGGSPGPFVLPGKYTVTMVVSGAEVGTTTVNVMPDPQVKISETDRRTHHDALMALQDMQAAVEAAGERLVAANEQLNTLESQARQAADGAAVLQGAIQPLRDRISALGRQLGIPVGGGAAGPGGGALEGGRGGGTQPLRTRLASTKSQIMASTSVPTEYQRQAIAEARQELDAALKSVDQIASRDVPALVKRLRSEDRSDVDLQATGSASSMRTAAFGSSAPMPE